MSKRRFSAREAEDVGDRLGIDWDQIPVEDG